MTNTPAICKEIQHFLFDLMAYGMNKNLPSHGEFKLLLMDT